MTEIIPFKGENSSHAFKTNLLLRQNNTYLMDNHRMAAWCWAQSIDLAKKYTIVHIDKHYDTSTHNQLEIYCEIIKKDLHHMTVNEYDELSYEFCKNNWAPVFRWDNYLTIFHTVYKRYIKNYLFFTQNCGMFWKEIEDFTVHYSVFNLVNHFPDYFENPENCLIINLDIDYFFSDNYDIILTDKIIEKILENIKQLLEHNDNILTIALSPECCGGWKNSLDFIKKYGKKIGLNNIPV